MSVFARGARKAAISVGFSSVHFGALNPSVFRFAPPAGAIVKQTPMHLPKSATHEPPSAARSHDVRPASLITFGSGWESIYALRTAGLPRGRDTKSLREMFPYSGPLFSVRLIERGDHSWIVAGFVPQSALVLIEPQLQ
ncbi:MAG: hypothetical protein E6G68_10540 [Actinobacteria bacterium]|nr:MAG: hypothetical protein E6G68_10540 [Actinomycetota bacterium]